MSEPMSYSQAAENLEGAKRVVRAAEAALDEAINTSADAEATYRRAIAGKIDEHREAGLSVEHAVAKARADVFVLSRERDVARDRIRKALETIENRRGERESLLRLVAWSHSIDIRARNGDAPGGID